MHISENIITRRALVNSQITLPCHCNCCCWQQTADSEGEERGRRAFFYFMQAKHDVDDGQRFISILWHFHRTLTSNVECWSEFVKLFLNCKLTDETLKRMSRRSLIFFTWTSLLWVIVTESHTSDEKRRLQWNFHTKNTFVYHENYLYAKRSLTLLHLDFSARLHEVYTRNCWSNEENSSLRKENAKCTWGNLLALFSVRRSREEQSEQRRRERRKIHENKTNFNPAPRHAHMAGCRQSFGTRALSLSDTLATQNKWFSVMSLNDMTMKMRIRFGY